ncbi:UDP-3-O-(3-hydroxymyristoyl)glucosamine N-acyltransferase [Deltaproteobacteria bacterium Smac51]|nr:UDP-3-O-(3-hydroxymyristoyl)glucosamine N-acyltransferase [Deltaproteobacteria bacterium Smac51]
MKELYETAVSSLTEGMTALGAPGAAPPVELRGDGSVVVMGLAAADEAEPGALAFAIAPNYLKKAAEAGASAVIITPALAGEELPLQAIICPEPRLIFAILLENRSRELKPAQVAGEAFFADRASVDIGYGAQIGQGAYIGRNVQIGRGTVIGPMAYLEDGVAIGADCIIHPRAVLRHGVRVGNRCQIHCGAVIGDDGFGYTQLPDMKTGRLIHYKNVHLGSVTIEDDVEIGAQSTIDRGLISDTIIGRGTKIDNLVQIGHNCRIGQDCIIVSQVGIGGHTVLGDRVFLLGQVGLGPGVTIGADAILTGQTGFGSGTIPAGRQPWSGTPARTQKDHLQVSALSFSQLPKVRKFFQLLKKADSFNALKEAFFAPDDKKDQS